MPLRNSTLHTPINHRTFFISVKFAVKSLPSKSMSLSRFFDLASLVLKIVFNEPLSGIALNLKILELLELILSNWELLRKAITLLSVVWWHGVAYRLHFVFLAGVFLAVLLTFWALYGLALQRHMVRFSTLVAGDGFARPRLRSRFLAFPTLTLLATPATVLITRQMVNMAFRLLWVLRFGYPSFSDANCSLTCSSSGLVPELLWRTLTVS